MPLDITGTSLDSTLARPANSHLPVLAQKSARQHTRNTKTDFVVVVVARVIVVARGRTAIIRLIEPSGGN